MTRILLIIIVVVVALLVGAGLLASHYHENAVTYKDQRDKAKDGLKLANDTINDMQVRQRDVAALDAKYTKELANAKAENDALQSKLDRGGRVRVKGSCPVQAPTKTAVTSGMGDDATVELSSVAGRNVLGIRSGIKQDQTALLTLQQYINEQCK